MKGLILAAGLGERLKPLTNNTPKALLSINNKPMLHYILQKYLQAGIKNTGIVIRKKHKNKFKNFSKKYNVNINFVFQNSPKGTADAILNSKKFVGSETFILSWCDFVSDYNLEKIIHKHKRTSSKATLLINKENSISSGQVLFNNTHITKIVEKPEYKISPWVSAGVMILEPDIFQAIEYCKSRSKKTKKEKEFHIAKAIQYWINSGKKIDYEKIDTWRVNVNDIKALKEAEHLLRNEVN